MAILIENSPSEECLIQDTGSREVGRGAAVTKLWPATSPAVYVESSQPQVHQCTVHA